MRLAIALPVNRRANVMRGERRTHLSVATLPFGPGHCQRTWEAGAGALPLNMIFTGAATAAPAGVLRTIVRWTTAACSEPGSRQPTAAGAGPSPPNHRHDRCSRWEGLMGIMRQEREAWRRVNGKIVNGEWKERVGRVARSNLSTFWVAGLTREPQRRSTPTPICFANHLSPDRRGRGVQAPIGRLCSRHSGAA